MVEEAAGTSMYESKRDQTNKLIEKKDAKLNEMDAVSKRKRKNASAPLYRLFYQFYQRGLHDWFDVTPQECQYFRNDSSFYLFSLPHFLLRQVLKDEIEPKLQKLRQERAQYEEFQKVVREIESLTRIYISYKYLQQKKTVENCENDLQTMVTFIETSKQTILDNEQRAVTIDEECADIRRVMDTESGGQLKQLEDELAVKSKQEATVMGEKNSVANNLDAENRKLKRTEKTIRDDENALKTKEAAMANLNSLFETLKNADQVDSNAYEESRKKYEAISSGLATNESGEASSLQDQLIGKKLDLATRRRRI